MKFLDQLLIIKRIDALVKRKATGTPDELAEKLEISRASVYRYINELKEMGASIEYSVERKSYLYTKSFFLEKIFTSLKI